MNKISVVLITKNEEHSIKNCLDSLHDFDEVVIYDNGSEDKTLEIAKEYSNVKVSQGPFFGFGKTKKHAVSLAKNDWIFSIDADEVMSEELSIELLSMSLQDNTIYQVRRDNYYNNKHIKCCGWYPERIVRLFNKNQTDFNAVVVHEKIQEKDLIQRQLVHPIKHYSFHKVGDFLDKIQKYSEIYANEHKGKKSSSILKAILRGKSMFIKSYLIKGGYKCGFEGFVISFFAGLGTCIKYLKLREKNLYE
jgi:glycosyltransferase involved in cell wall biosynthesis